jgi:capsular polysaccharide biosynthesis protein
MEEISLRELIEVLLKRKWLIISITLVALLLSGIISFFILPPVYEAKEVLNIRGGEKAAIPDMKELDLGISLEQLTRIPLYDIETYRQQILSYPFLEELISSLDQLEEMTPPALRESVTIEQVPNTSLMRIKVRHEDPVLAASIANKISELFIRQNNIRNQEQFEKFTSFLLEQMEEKKEQLEVVMEEYRDFLKQPRSPAPPGARGSSSSLESQGLLLQSSEGDELKEELNFKIASLTGYKTALTDLKIRLATARKERESLERQLEETPQFIVTQKSLVDDPLLLQAAAGKGEQDDFEHLAGLQFRSEEVNPVYLELEANLKNKNVQIDALSKEIEETALAISSLESELAELREEYLEKWREQERLERDILPGVHPGDAGGQLPGAADGVCLGSRRGQLYRGRPCFSAGKTRAAPQDAQHGRSRGAGAHAKRFPGLLLALLGNFRG